MELNTVEQIERAIDLLAPPQVAELCEWLESRQGQLLDDRMRLDLDAVGPHGANVPRPF